MDRQSGRKAPRQGQPSDPLMRAWDCTSSPDKPKKFTRLFQKSAKKRKLSNSDEDDEDTPEKPAKMKKQKVVSEDDEDTVKTQKVYRFSDFEHGEVSSSSDEEDDGSDEEEEEPGPRMWDRYTEFHPTWRSTRWPDLSLFTKRQPVRRGGCFGECCFLPGLNCEHNDPATMNRRAKFTEDPTPDQEDDKADGGKHTCWANWDDYIDPDQGFGPVKTGSKMVDNECDGEEDY
jgi:hypothetical protein